MLLSFGCDRCFSVCSAQLRGCSGHPVPRPLAEHVAARFGKEDVHSYAAFAVSEDLGQDFSISLFLRTRRLDGFVLALDNGSSQYLHVWLEDGKVAAQLDSLEILRSKSPVDDGGVHLVSLEMEAGRMRLQVAAQKQGEVEVGRVAVEAGHSVHVGGLTGGRRISVFGGYLKGCIQDLRMNERRLQFFPLDTSAPSFPLKLMENVTAGCSGDDGCTVSPVNSGGWRRSFQGQPFTSSTAFCSSEEALSARGDLLPHVG